jgi:hypothetical protein
MRPSPSNSPDAVAEYLTRRSAMEMPIIARAIGTAARAGGMAEVARVECRDDRSSVRNARGRKRSGPRR